MNEKTCITCIYCSGPHHSGIIGKFFICRENSNFNKVVPKVDWCSKWKELYD